MNCKKVVVLSLSLSMLLLTLTYGAVVRATPEERRTVYDMEYFLGFKVSVEAPYEVNLGENITVTVSAEALSSIYVEYIYVNIYRLNETEEISLANITCVEKEHLTGLRTVNQIITIPNDTSPGLTYGIIRWEWESPPAILPGVEFSLEVTPPPVGFIVTYVRNLELEELQAAYDELNATYNSLLANYTELENYKGELGSTRNLMYIFVATTVVSAATAFILLIRRPKRLWT